MSETRKGVNCAYCAASFSIKYNSDDINKPEFCCFCSESFDDPTEEIEDEEDDDDMEDYPEGDGNDLD